MRISLSGSAAKAAPGNKVETANMAAMARREILDMEPLPKAWKTPLFFNMLALKAMRKYISAMRSR